MDLVWENEGTSIYFSEEKLPDSLLRHIYQRGCHEKVPSFLFGFDWFQRRRRFQGGGVNMMNMGAGGFQIVPRSHLPEWDDLLRYLIYTRFTDDHVIVARLAESIISRAKSIAGGRDQEPLINVSLHVHTTSREEDEVVVLVESDPEEEEEDEEEEEEEEESNYYMMDLDGWLVKESVAKKMAAMEGSWKNKALGEDESKDCCAICFQMLGRVVKVTPCRHYFHQSCIFQWLNTSIVCPLCRFQFMEC